MESDSEDESGKTYTTLENIPYTEPSANYQLQFEQFVVGERSDDESEGGDEEKAEESDQDEEPARENETPLVEDVLDDLDISPSSQQCILKSEEVAVIESCHHNELKNLLRMNRSKHFMLMQLFKKVKDLLIDCRNDIHSLTKLSQQSESIENQSMQLTLLAAPYFKTKKEMFSSAPNKDTLARRQNGELSIYQNVMTPKWSRNECENLISAVKLTYNHNKQKAILRKIGGLRFKLDKEMGDTKLALGIVEQIDRLEEELKDLKEIGSNDIPPLGKDEFIDWEHISDGYMKDKHTALECRAFWHIYLHPDINKSNWNPEENTKIRELVLKHKQQDWDQIALELGTKRSGFSVCLHYLSVLCEKFSKMRFTKEEDNLILEHVERLRIGSFIPWSAIETFFPNRSRQQLVHRYKYFLNTSDRGDSTFTDAEDILILILVDRFGRRYSKFAHFLPHRRYMQIKNRYDVHLRAFSTRGCFTLEEDQTLMKYITSQKFKNVGGLARLMSRSRGQLRQRFRTLKAFLDKHPNKTLADAPRRMGSKVEAGRKLEFLKCIAEQFKGQPDVPTIQEIEMKLGLKNHKTMKKQSENQESFNADSLLINFFSNSYKIKKKPFETSTLRIREAAETVFDILMKWKVNLIIPDELKKSNFLDIIDLEILALLRQKYNQVDVDISSAVLDLIPPNMNTIIGLRGLLLKNQLYKRTKNRAKLTLMDELPLIRNKSDDNLAGELIEMMKDMNADEKNQIENERCLFLERFISLFLWPAIFSIESPSERLLNAELGIRNKVERTVESSENRQRLKTKKKKADPIVKVVKDEPVLKKPKLSLPDNKEQSINGKQPPTTHMSLRPRKCKSILKTGEEGLENENNSHISDENPPNEQKPPNEKKSEINQKSTKIIKIIKKNTARTEIPKENTNKADLNKPNSTKPNSTKPVRIIRIIKVNKDEKLGMEEISEEMNEVPSNLKRVEKIEVENMLKNEKQVKLFMIQKIKMKDGTFKTIRKPYDKKQLPILSKLSNITDNSSNSQVKIVRKPPNENKNIIMRPPVKKKLLADNANILDIVSLADSVKEECNTSGPHVAVKKNINTDHPDLKDLKTLNDILKDNIKQYSKRLSSKLSSNRISKVTNDRLPLSNYTSEKIKVQKTSVIKDKEDVDKLDEFLKNFQTDDDDDDSLVDLTEDEVTKNEVELLNNLIRTERQI